VSAATLRRFGIEFVDGERRLELERREAPTETDAADRFTGMARER